MAAWFNIGDREGAFTPWQVFVLPVPATPWIVFVGAHPAMKYMYPAFLKG